MLQEGWVPANSNYAGPPQRPVPMPPRNTQVPGIYSKVEYDTSHFYNDLLKENPDQKNENEETVIHFDSFPKLINRYEIGGEIGSGVTAVIRAAKDKVSGNFVVIKCISPATNIVFFVAKAWRSVGKLLDECAGDHVVKKLDILEEDDHLFIVLERYAGPIIRILKKLDKPWTQADACRVVKQLLEVARIVHDRGLTHCDFTPGNILAADNDISSIKVSGFTKVATQAFEGDLLCETQFKAPEVLENKVHDKAIDIWTIGCVAYLLLSGKLPFDDTDNSKLTAAIISGQVSFPASHWEHIDPQAKAFVVSLLQKDPAVRPTANAAFAR